MSSSELDLGGLTLIVKDIKIGPTRPGQEASATLSNRRAVVDDALTVALTTAQSGGLIRVDKTDGVTITLPTPAVGLTYDLVVTASTASGNTKIITSGATVFLVGTIRMFDTDTLTDPLSVATANGTTHVALTMSGSTTGGLLGTHLRFTCVAATLWVVEGTVHHNGAVATPFATS